jgi:NADPH2:quinone reductase
MRAVGVTEFGGPEALHVIELPEPQAGPGEMRIRVRAAAVNPTDTLIRSGARARQLQDIPPPYVPGMDVAGVLDQIGPGVTTGLRTGERVMAIVVPSGSHGLTPSSSWSRPGRWPGRRRARRTPRRRRCR